MTKGLVAIPQIGLIALAAWLLAWPSVGVSAEELSAGADGDPRSNEALVLVGTELKHDDRGRVVKITSGKAGLDDRDLDALLPLTSTRDVFLYDTALSDDSVVALLRHWRQLESVTLSGRCVSEKTLRQACLSPQLRKLDIIGPAVPGDGLKDIGRLDQLQLLGLTQLGLDDEDVRRLGQLTALERLILNGNTKILGSGLEKLAPLTKLEYLELSNTGVGDGCIKHIASLGALKYLLLSKSAVTGKTLAELDKLDHLEYLALGHTSISDAHIEQLAKLRKLKVLRLSRTNITDRSVETLMKMSHLEFVELFGAKLTEDAVRRLEDALPNADILFTPATEE
jgi:hypothetical protein